MKVVFTMDVHGMAKAGDTKEVSDGYARNFLIPNKLALPSSGSIANTIETRLVARTRRQAKNRTELMRTAAALNGKEVTIEARAGAKYRLYGAVTSADIATGIEETTGYAIDKRKIELGKPIHHLGSQEVSIKLGKEITARIKVSVVAKED